MRAPWTSGERVNWECDARYCQSNIVRAFDCGQFCEKHWYEMATCSEEGCDNPAVPGKFNPEGVCRLCQFDYDPVVYHQRRHELGGLWYKNDG